MPGRRLATVLFIDIVGSTSLASTRGDVEWHAMLDRFFRGVRRQLRRYQGREVNETGDGMVAAFRGSTSAIHCAWVIKEVARDIGLEVRSGIHMGEVEKRGRSVGGVAVHIGARIVAEAGAGQILVSQTVRDIEEGSGFRFEDQGKRALKGVSGEWRLFAVESVPDRPRASFLESRALPETRRGLIAGIIAFLVLLSLAGLFGPWGTNSGPPNEPSLGLSASSHTQITFSGHVGASSISPDGEMIAYASGLQEGEALVVQDLAGGEPLEIGRFDDVGDIRWSPSGESIAVDTRNKTSARLFLFPRRGGSPREIFSGFSVRFDWSPDGRRLVLLPIAIKRLFFVEVSTGDTTSVALPDSYNWGLDVDWSPLGDHIAYLTQAEPSKFIIWSLSVATNEARRVVEDSTPLSTPRWSHAGEAIYYLRTSGEVPELIRSEIFPASGESIPSRRVVLSVSDMSDFSLSDEDDRILYLRRQIFSNLWLITPHPPDAPEARQLTTGTAFKTSFSLSPNGRDIAIAIRRSASSANIHVISVGDGKMKQLTYLEGVTTAPAWSPDGSEIAFASTHDGTNRIWKIDANGESPRSFQDTEPSVTPYVTWAPGNRILYLGTGNRMFNVLDPESGVHRPLVSNEGVGYMFNAVYSPDGGSVALSWNRPPQPGMWIISLDGEEQTLVGGRGGYEWPIAWFRGGWIYSYLGDTSQVVRYHMTGHLVSDTLALDCGTEVLDIEMTPDGRSFLCLEADEVSDLWTATGFSLAGGKRRSAP